MYTNDLQVVRVLYSFCFVSQKIFEIDLLAGAYHMRRDILEALGLFVSLDVMRLVYSYSHRMQVFY